MSTAAKLIDISGRVPLYSIHASEVKSKKSACKFPAVLVKLKSVFGVFPKIKTLPEVKHKR